MSDSISRQAALDIFDDYNVAVENGQIEAYSRDRKRLCDLPPAQPEQNFDEWCTDCKEYDKEKHSCPRWNRVIRQTLADAQPEPCDDAVSRAEVLRMINCINDHHAITPYKSVGAVTEHLTRIASNLPPVTPKQRTGKWERHYSRPNVYADLCWHCSACGYYHADNWTNKFKFCPNCGAKMEGANNDT